MNDRRASDLGFGLRANLPGLIGRQSQIDEVTRLVARCRLVTVTGPSGIGKTRVAIEVARRIQDTHRSHAALVELAPVAEPDLVARSVASALGLKSQPGRHPLDALVADLRPLTILLVLDNCEHVLAGAAELVDRVLGECDGVSVLATSQHQLEVDGEQVIPLPPLSVPEVVTSPERAVAESEAVALFCARAEAIKEDFALTEETLPFVVEICRRLDGIPLAIELAAARMAVMGPAEIAERLEHRFGLLTGGTRGSPPRHQTLRAAIDWSYGLLSEAEATLLRRLSVFAGGADPSAVRQVTSGDGMAPEDVDGLLHSLVARSLVVTVTETSRGPARYHLLETVKAYATEVLEQAGETGAVCRRHALWCVTRAELLAREDVDMEWIAELEADHDNLRGALAWSVRADAVLALRLATALIGFWQMRGDYEEGQRWLTRALNAVAEAGLSVSAPPELRAEALLGIGALATVRGLVDAARPVLESALAVAQGANLASQETKALNLLGFVALISQQARTAKPQLEEAVARARSSGHAPALGHALRMLGAAHLFLGELDEARQVFGECLDLSEDSPAMALFGLARTEYAAGHDGRAQEQFEVAVPMLRSIGERFQVTLGLGFLGESAWARGDIAAARALAQEGLDEARALGAAYPEASCLSVLAEVTWSEGDSATARQLAEQACRVASGARLGYALVRCLGVRGLVKRTAGDLEGARDDYEEALATATANGDRQGRALSMRHLAGLLRMFGDYEDATALLQQAIAIEAEIGGGGLASGLEALAGVEIDQDRPASAATLFGAAESIRTSGGPFRRPDEMPGYEADVVALRASLTGRQLQSAWARGAALSIEQAVGLAMAEEESVPQAPGGAALLASLTRSERRIVELVAAGMSSRQVGEQLGISERTVQGHVGRALSKLHLTSRNQLRGLIHGPDQRPSP